MSKLSAIISRIEKLLRVAARSDHPGEVEAAQLLAQELITKYQIEEAQLNDHFSGDDIISRKVPVPPPYVIDKSVLLNSIAKHNFCKVLRSDDYCLIFGYESDIKLCLALYETLSLHMVSEMFIKLTKAKENPEKKFHTKTWIKSFFGGYALSISERIRESKVKVIKETEAAGTSVALMIRDKEHAIELYFQKLDRKPGYDRKLESSDGFNSGIESGKKANIHQTPIEG